MVFYTTIIKNGYIVHVRKETSLIDEWRMEDSYNIFLNIAGTQYLNATFLSMNIVLLMARETHFYSHITEVYKTYVNQCYAPNEDCFVFLGLK